MSSGYTSVYLSLNEFLLRNFIIRWSKKSETLMLEGLGLREKTIKLT